MDFDHQQYEPKVHLFHDNSADRAKGRKWMKDIYCRGNSGNAITNNPKNVTCLRCLRRMQDMARKSPGMLSFEDAEAMSQTIREAEAEANEWRDDANRLAEVLALAFRNIEDDRQHVIVVPGTQITLGQVIAGTLAVHAEVKGRLPDA